MKRTKTLWLLPLVLVQAFTFLVLVRVGWGGRLAHAYTILLDGGALSDSFLWVCSSSLPPLLALLFCVVSLASIVIGSFWSRIGQSVPLVVLSVSLAASLLLLLFVTAALSLPMLSIIGKLMAEGRW